MGMKKIISRLAFLSFCGQIPVHAQQTMVVSRGSVVTVQSGADMYISGGINLDDQSKLFNEGTVTISNPGSTTIDFKDISTTSYRYGSGKFIFAGQGNQRLLSANQFGQIEINNGGLDLASDISSGYWTLNSGKINTGSYFVIVGSADGDAISAGQFNEGFSKSWINGKMRRFVNPSATNSYLFPVGDYSKVNIAMMNDLSNHPLTGIRFINASFTSRSGNDGGLNISLPGKTCTGVCNGGVWHLQPNADPTSGHYSLQLFINGFTGLENKEFSIINRPDASVNAAEWLIPSGDPVAGNSSLYVSRNRLSSFGQFGIGIITRVTPVISNTETGKTNSLKVYPNPVIDKEFYVEYKGGKINGLKLIAGDGKIVACNFNLQKSGQLRVTLPFLLAKGIYTLQIDTENGLHSTLISLQ